MPWCKDLFEPDLAHPRRELQNNPLFRPDGIFADHSRGHHAVALENLALRQQLAALKRISNRPQIRASDRIFWIILSSAWRDWRRALVFVKPDTVVRWHREWLRRRWTARSRQKRPGRPTTDQAIRTLVVQMAAANPLWGAPRIHGENCRSSALRSPSERFRGSCAGVIAHRRKPGGRFSPITSPPWSRWTSSQSRPSPAGCCSSWCCSLMRGAGSCTGLSLTIPRRCGPPSRSWKPSGRQRSPMAVARSRLDLQRGVSAPRGQHGHCGGDRESMQSLAESLCGAPDRFPASRVSRSPHRVQRNTFAADACSVYRLLSPSPHASVVSEGRAHTTSSTGSSRGPSRRLPGSRWVAPPVRTARRLNLPTRPHTSGSVDALSASPALDPLHRQELAIIAPPASNTGFNNRRRPRGRFLAKDNRKGKKRTRSREARSARGESHEICSRKWLLRLDSNQQPSG